TIEIFGIAITSGACRFMSGRIAQYQLGCCDVCHRWTQNFELIRFYNLADAGQRCHERRAHTPRNRTCDGESADCFLDGQAAGTSHKSHAPEVACLLITTEAMVAEKPKRETPMPAMPPGGGMDY